MYKVVHFTIDFLLKGGVQRWIDLFAKYTKDTFRHYVLTPNRLLHYNYENCIVPSFRHVQDNLKKYWNENFIPSTSHYITSEIIEYTRKLSPEVIIIYGNDAKELFIPAKLFSDKSLVISRCQHEIGLPPEEFIEKYIDAFITFNNKLDIYNKPVLKLYRSYDDRIFNVRIPYENRIDNVVAYFGRWACARVGCKRDNNERMPHLLATLRKYNIGLHAYTTPTPPQLRNEMNELKRRFPNIEFYDWILDADMLARTKNKYKVIVDVTRAHDIFLTFGQSNVESLACGANLVLLLNDSSLNSQNNSFYLPFIKQYVYTANNPKEMGEIIYKILKQGGWKEKLTSDDLMLFKMSYQKNLIKDFIITLYKQKFGKTL